MLLKLILPVCFISFIWLLENFELPILLTFVACIVFLLNSTSLGHSLQVLELCIVLSDYTSFLVCKFLT